MMPPDDGTPPIQDKANIVPPGEAFPLRVRAGMRNIQTTLRQAPRVVPMVLTLHPAQKFVLGIFHYFFVSALTACQSASSFFHDSARTFQR